MWAVKAANLSKLASYGISLYIATDLIKHRSLFTDHVYPFQKAIYELFRRHALRNHSPLSLRGTKRLNGKKNAGRK